MKYPQAAALEPHVAQADWLVCPDCGRGLNGSGGALTCIGCGHTWPVVDGVPHFVTEFPYWGEIPQEQMQEVILQAMAGSWRSALLDSSEPTVQRASGMILNLERANWQWLVNLPPESRVLDLGAGIGINTHPDTHLQGVGAVEPVLERVQYSSRGYRKLLQETGFSYVEMYLALPSYNHPRYLIPVEQRQFNHFSRTFNAPKPGGLGGMLLGMLNRTGLLKRLQYSYVILARK
jgi:hypothetical protein